MDNDYKQQMVHQLYTAKNAERLHVSWTEPMDNDYKQQMVHQLYTAKNAERLHVSWTEPMDRLQITDGTSAIHRCREVTCIMDRANGQ